MQVGGFVYPFHEMSTRAPSWRRSSATRRTSSRRAGGPQAHAGAGYGQGIRNLDFVVRDIATFKLWAVASRPC